MGLFKLDISLPSKAKIEMIKDDNFFNVTISTCERIVAATGRTKVIELYEAATMRRLCSLPYENVYHLRMSSD
jgi:hypothetical protein